MENQMQVATISTSATMSSREIAALTGKELSHVHRDIRAMLKELKKDDPDLDEPKEDKDARGYTTCFHLNRDLTDCLLTGYSAAARMRVIKRWRELEAKETQVMALPDFNNPAIAARAWAEQYEAKTLALEVVETQKIQLANQAPAVEYVDKFVKADGLFGVREAAKACGIQQNAFINLMIDAKLMFRENGHLQAYAQDITAGRFVVKTELDANGKARPSTKLTAKGIYWARGKLKLDQLFND